MADIDICIINSIVYKAFYKKKKKKEKLTTTLQRSFIAFFNGYKTDI